MNLGAYTYRLHTLLNEAKNILIFLTKEPDMDEVAAALALYLSLSQKGKQIVVVCPDKMTVEESNLFAIDKITDELGKGGKNLVISFPYIEGSIEKVSYNIENNRFNLVIEPRGEGELLQEENITFTRSGEGADNFDLIFTIGVSDFGDLGKFQSTHQKLLEEKNVVVINNKSSNVPFGTLRITNPNNSSVSGIVTLLLSKINMPIDRDIADNLLKGIKEKTANFSRNLSADSFEAAAICMRRIGLGSVGAGEARGATQIVRPPVARTFPQNPQLPRQPSEQKKAPPDWLKPKIFRSSNSTSIMNNNNNKGTLI